MDGNHSAVKPKRIQVGGVHYERDPVSGWRAIHYGGSITRIANPHVCTLLDEIAWLRDEQERAG